jgi:hypothetical protein
MGTTFPDHSSYHWATPDSYLTVKGMTRFQSTHNMVLHGGDIAYATGYEAKWDMFMHGIEPLASHVPYMVGLGNHEQDWPGTNTFYQGTDSGGECGVAATARFPMPTPNSWSSPGQSWYSFDYGPVHVIMWDTEVPIAPGSMQYMWMAENLAAVDRTQTPWVVVFGHRPMYTDATRDENIGLLEPLLMDFKVDLSLYGHVHNAQLYVPMYNSTAITAPDGEYSAPIHAVVGNAGMDLSPFKDPVSPLTQYHAEEWGWSTLEFNATHMHMGFWADESQELHYDFTVYRAYPRK